MPDPETQVAAIALGSNLPSRFGSPAANLREAIGRVALLGRVAVVSSFFATAPVGFLEQPDFVNAALLLDTQLSPDALMRGLLAVETGMGRQREGAPAKGPRVIDLDLLMYADRVQRTPALTLPHAALAERGFVLKPLAEIAPDLVHPLLGKTVAQLLSEFRAARQG